MEANTFTTRDIEALSWKLREASDADMHHSSILLPPHKCPRELLHVSRLAIASPIPTASSFSLFLFKKKNTYSHLLEINLIIS